MQMQKSDVEKTIADSRAKRIWIFLRWLLFLPIAGIAFSIAGFLGALISRAFNPINHEVDVYALMFCGTYAAILAGAFVAPERLLAGRILSCLYFFLGLIIAFANNGPRIDNTVHWLTVLVVILAISAAYATIWLWGKKPRNVTSL